MTSTHALNVAASFDLCSHEPGIKAPRLTVTEAGATLNLAVSLTHGARIPDDLRYPRFLMRVLDNTADCPASTGGLAALLRKRTEDLAPPPPEPSFDTWSIQYQASPGGGWTTVTHYNTYADAHRDLPTHKRSPGNYRIIGITE